MGGSSSRERPRPFRDGAQGRLAGSRARLSRRHMENTADPPPSSARYSQSSMRSFKSEHRRLRGTVYVGVLGVRCASPATHRLLQSLSSSSHLLAVRPISGPDCAVQVTQCLPKVNTRGRISHRRSCVCHGAGSPDSKRQGQQPAVRRSIAMQRCENALLSQACGKQGVHIT